MTEAQAKAILNTKFKDKKVNAHLKRINSIGQGHLLELEAKKYLEELETKKKS